MKLLAWGLIIINTLLCSGCAVFNRNNTPALNFVEQHMLPKEKPGRMLAYPVAIPAGLVAASLDMLVLHPASVVKDSWNDTGDLLWEKLEWQERYVTTTVSLLPRVVATPVVFTGDFLARSIFDISRRGGDVRLNKGNNQRREERERQVADVQRALEQKDSDAALTMAEEILKQDPYNQKVAVIKATICLERRNLAALATMPPSLPLFRNDRFSTLFADVLSNGSPVERMQALLILERSHYVPAVQQADKGSQSKRYADLMLALEKNLADSDRAIQMKTMQLLGKYQRSNPSSKSLLEKITLGADPVLAAVATALLK